MSFLVFSDVVERILPCDYYNNAMLGVHVDTRVLKSLLQIRLPHIIAKFDAQGVEIANIVFPWFACVFLQTLPIESACRVFDCLLTSGSIVLFQVAVALIYISQDHIMTCNETDVMWKKMQTLGKNVFDVDKLFEVAFSSTLNIGWNEINNQRRYHRKILVEEHNRMSQLREQLQKEELQESIQE
jgi:hypothetical protein